MKKLLFILFFLFVGVVTMGDGRYIEIRKAIAIHKSFVVNGLDSKYDINKDYDFNYYLQTNSVIVENSTKILNNITIQRKNYSLYIYPYLKFPADREAEVGLRFDFKF